MAENNPFANALSGIIARSQQNFKINPGDYEADGIVMCGKCNTPKQSYVELPYGKVLVAQMCECEAAEFDRRIADERQKKRIDEIRRKAFPEELVAEMSRQTLENDDGKNPELTKAVRKYIDEFARYSAAGKGILFHGQRGRGKSYAMCAIVNALIDRGHTAKFTTFSAIANEMTELREGKEEYLNGFARFDVLAIDDLDAERATEFVQEIVYRVIDTRVTSKKPLLLTTNLTGQEMAAESSLAKQRVYSRIYEACVPFEVKGEDRRFAALRRAQEEFRLD